MSRTLTFDDWLDYVFNRPIAEAEDDGDAWYWQKDGEGNDLAWWVPEANVIADYLIRMMESPAMLMTKFSEMQIAQGLWFIFSCCSNPTEGFDEEGYEWFTTEEYDHNAINYVLRVMHESVHHSVQERLIRSIFILYRDLFAPNCSNWFGLRRDPPLPDDPEFVQPLDGVCWMLWDLNGVYQLLAIPRLHYLVEPGFAVLSQILRLNSAQCQAAALHALGHLQPSFPDRVAAMIDDYVAQSVDLHPNLVRYAADAKAGSVN